MILVTGGAGFIGSNFVRSCIRSTNEAVVNVDKLTYAGNPENFEDLLEDQRHVFIREDITSQDAMAQIIAKFRPRAIVNFAAESHVDRSIHGPGDFITTNVVGTYVLLEAARAYWSRLQQSERDAFRFVHVSTDEVYGSLLPDEPPFTETTAFAPNSPYAASKASSDHLVRAWHHTYGLPTIITNCSNNYGPYQFPEKLIPLLICNALNDSALPIYGDGLNVRDWLYVDDHCRALLLVLNAGRAGETYNIGGWNEQTNIEIARTVCAVLDELRPRADGSPYSRLIKFVSDRPGHDRRYAIDATKIERELGWRPAETFASGIRKTASWYLENQKWVGRVLNGSYREWIAKNYGERA